MGIMGTNIDTLRRAANTLSLLAQQDISSNIFMVVEERLVKLAMSPVLDQEVAKSICEAMFLSSRVYETGRRRLLDKNQSDFRRFKLKSCKYSLVEQTNIK